MTIDKCDLHLLLDIPQSETGLDALVKPELALPSDSSRAQYRPSEGGGYGYNTLHRTRNP